MTEISRSIEIFAPVEKVWTTIHPKNWPNIFYFVKEVDGYTDGKSVVGTHARIIAGDSDISSIKYTVEITEYDEKKRIAYKRYGGPLVGSGIIQLKRLNDGTLLRRTSFYNDSLSEETLKALSAGMENDNLRIKDMIEGKTP